jgi:two-component system chemotaxis sensor kinase CheA
VAHVGESLLSRMRDGQLRLNADITTALLSMVDAVREILRAIEASGTEGDGEYAAVIERLKELLQEQPKPAAPARIGEILIKHADVPREAIEAALAQQQAGDPRRIGEILVERGDVQPQAVLEALKSQNEVGSQVSGSSLRVDVNLLDKLMNLVGELVLARNQILQFTVTQNDSNFLGTAQRLNLITTELQEGVMKTRMHPIGNVWN